MGGLEGCAGNVTITTTTPAGLLRASKPEFTGSANSSRQLRAQGLPDNGKCAFSHRPHTHTHTQLAFQPGTVLMLRMNASGSMFTRTGWFHRCDRSLYRPPLEGLAETSLGQGTVLLLMLPEGCVEGYLAVGLSHVITPYTKSVASVSCGGYLAKGSKAMLMDAVLGFLLLG